MKRAKKPELICELKTPFETPNDVSSVASLAAEVAVKTAEVVATDDQRSTIMRP
ncbi:MAG: hypothetical protein IIC53_14040 [Proteobacteria bacterium]|nr:hypothetical protein [Pseudomonadota bacterium]